MPPQSIYTIYTIKTISDVMNTTTISVKKETKDMLDSFGAKGDTYDDVISEMSVAYEEFMELQYQRLGEKNRFRKLAL